MACGLVSHVSYLCIRVISCNTRTSVCSLLIASPTSPGGDNHANGEGERFEFFFFFFVQAAMFMCSE